MGGGVRPKISGKTVRPDEPLLNRSHGFRRATAMGKEGEKKMGSL